MDHMRDEFAGSLSGGQRKLLEMARALMADPTLIMLDEPMAGVNPALKQSLLGHVKELKDEGRTVLFVEHDMDMVHEISDWVVVMAEGEIIAEGTATDDLGQPGGHRRLSRCAPRSRSRLRATRRRRAARLEQQDGDAMTNIIECTDLVAGYVPGVNILNGCDLVVAAGEFVGIIGPNGAGKSTLMKAVLGLVTIRSGSVKLDGDDITGQPPHELVAAGRRLRAAEQQRVPVAHRAREPRDGLLRQSEELRSDRYEVVTACSPASPSAADQKAGSLSGGERQMVAMGRALMLDPSCCCSTSRPPACRRCCRTRCSCGAS